MNKKANTENIILFCLIGILIILITLNGFDLMIGQYREQVNTYGKYVGSASEVACYKHCNGSEYYYSPGNTFKQPYCLCK